jgi:antitoxin VapB
VALCIKNAETERLAHEVAQQTGESLTKAISVALRERLQRLRRGCKGRVKTARIQEVLRRLDRMRRLDNLWVDEVLRYDKNGLPH